MVSGGEGEGECGLVKCCGLSLSAGAGHFTHNCAAAVTGVRRHEDHLRSTNVRTGNGAMNQVHAIGPFCELQLASAQFSWREMYNIIVLDFYRQLVFRASK